MSITAYDDWGNIDLNFRDGTNGTADRYSEDENEEKKLLS